MWLWILLGLVLLLLGALIGVSLYLFRFAVVRGREEKPDFSKEDSIWHPYRERMESAQKWLREHTAEHVEITSFDGLKLRALLIPAESANPDERGVPAEQAEGTMIVMHGYRSLAEVDFALEAEFLHNLGYRLLIPYQRSHGESEGTYITYGVKERFDCRDWARYAERRFGNGPLFLAGISMGCSTVLMAAGLQLPRNVRGIIADCGFTSPWEIMAHVARRDFKLPPFPLLYTTSLVCRIAAGFGLREASTLDAMRHSRIPVLFLHGKEDDFVPVRMTLENYHACAADKADKELYLVEGAGHAQSFAADTAGCEQKIREFIRKQE